MTLTPSERPLGVIFDMDGTLTEPTIDFAALRAALALPTGDILGWVERLSGEDRVRADAIIHEHEASAPMILRPSCLTLLAALDDANLPYAIITRNSARGVARFLELVGAHAPRFAPTLDRSFLPPKPDPASLLHVAQTWGTPIGDLVMVGDSIHDIAAATAAGALPVLIGSRHDPEAARLAAHHITRLDELIPILGL